VVDQLFKFNLTFSIVCVFSLQFEKISVFKRSGSFAIESSTSDLKKNTLYDMKAVAVLKVKPT
jgi:hypothetical protein